MNATGYLLAGQSTELERLRLQSLVWEASGRRLLEEVDAGGGPGGGARSLDVGCGALGWLRVLSEWVGPDGAVTGTDIDDAMLAAAATFCTAEGLDNVRLLEAADAGGARGGGARSLDVGCGVLGWLRVLSEWVGPDGAVTGTDIDDAMLAAAATFCTAEGLDNVRLVRDDLFASRLEAASFDLVHARFELTPLGRGPDQMATYLRLLRPGGTVVLEDPDWGSWHFNPPAPALEHLIALIVAAFRRWGDVDAARKHPALLQSFGIEPHLRAEVLALPTGHPYLRLPLQMAAGLQPRLREFTGAAELERLRQHGEAELAEPGRWGTTFTLLQCWGSTES